MQKPDFFIDTDTGSIQVTTTDAASKAGNGFASATLTVNKRKFKSSLDVLTSIDEAFQEVIAVFRKSEQAPGWMTDTMDTLEVFGIPSKYRDVDTIEIVEVKGIVTGRFFLLSVTIKHQLNKGAENTFVSKLSLV